VVPAGHWNRARDGRGAGVPRGRRVTLRTSLNVVKDPSGELGLVSGVGSYLDWSRSAGSTTGMQGGV
jgi:hypothetical protein